MILQFLLIGFFLAASTKASTTCKLPLDFQIKKEGIVKPVGVAGVTDFLFLSPTQILIANFPEKNKEQAPLHIYSLTKNGWTYDPNASAKLPSSFHPRHMVYEDLDGDKVKEVVIADHGNDKPPFPGSHPWIIKKVQGAWTLDPSSKTLGSAFTFNVAVLDLGKEKAIYKANYNNSSRVLNVNAKNEWKDATNKLPDELINHGLCYMTALVEDFDKDGKKDMYIGGCDLENGTAKQTHDRLLTNRKGKWELLPEKTLPPRKQHHSWGTVYIKSLHLNSDNKPDIMVATHDFGFHIWSVTSYLNESTPGKFLFKELSVPLKQEAQTEGFVNSFEDFQVAGYSLGILAEVRSVIRAPGKKFPTRSTRFLLQDKSGLVDASECLPEELTKKYFQMKKYPDDKSKVLLVPFEGDIFSLKVSKK